MLKIVALISGSATNLEALLQALLEQNIAAQVVAIGSDTPKANLALGHKYEIDTFCVDFSAYSDRATWCAQLANQVRSYQPDLVLLSGFMRLVSPEFVDEFSPALLNTHPAYLPEFPGAHAVRDALAAGATQTGATVMVVDNGVDTGPILVQERIDINSDDSEETLHGRIKIVERRLLIGVIKRIAETYAQNGELKIF